MKAQGGRSHTFTSRDFEILHFIWRWKIISTASIFAHFFPLSIKAHTAYLRLRTLANRGLLEEIWIRDIGFYWVLSKKGFELIRTDLPVESDAGYKTESPIHDVISTAIHLGPWTKVPPYIQVISEQELRCLPMEEYPTWVPRTDLRRPDGYWWIDHKGKKYLIALEVELNHKAHEEYSLMARFYSEQSKISRVVWVVKSMAFANTLLSIFEKVSPQDTLIHSFVFLKDIKNLGWMAPIYSGHEKGKPLAFILDRRGLETPETFRTLWNLDGRKCPYKLTTSAISAVRYFRNCGVSPTTHSSSQSQQPFSIRAIAKDSTSLYGQSVTHENEDIQHEVK